jgi:hypothetical protein
VSIHMVVGLDAGLCEMLMLYDTRMQIYIQDFRATSLDTISVVELSEPFSYKPLAPV